MRTTGLLLALWCVLLPSLRGAEPTFDLSDLPAHPRLLLQAGEEEALRERIASSPFWQEIHAGIIAEADRILEIPPSERVMTGIRLLHVVRENLRHIFILSYAYRLEGEKKYLRRAEAELLKTASYSDWNPSHFLDVGEMTFGMAIGYDWLYHDLSKKSRATIRQAIIEKGLYASYEGDLPEGYNQLPFGRWFISTKNNWNQVCHAGLTFGSLAVAEDAPQLAHDLITRAITNIRIPMALYAPNGTYPEGISYWGYGTLYNVLFLDAIESTLGSDFGLKELPGFMETAQYALQMVTPTGRTFNYMDNSDRPEVSSAPFWFYTQTGDPSLLYQQINLLQADTSQNYVQNRDFPAVMVWGAGAPTNPIPAPQEKFWVGYGPTPVAVMRSEWGNPEAHFLGVKFGSPSAPHGHMDVGSFIFEAVGVRWAIDRGSEDYPTMESRGLHIWAMTQESQRWDVFRYHNSAHNTLTFNGRHQVVTGSAIPQTTSSNPTQQFVTTDLTSLYTPQIERAERAYSLVGGNYAVIEDRITAGPHYARMRWTMATEATVRQIDSSTLELTQAGKRCYVVVESPLPIRCYLEPTSTLNSFDSPAPEVTMIRFDTELPVGEQSIFRVYLMPQEELTPTEYRPPFGATDNAKNLN